MSGSARQGIATISQLRCSRPADQCTGAAQLLRPVASTTAETGSGPGHLRLAASDSPNHPLITTR